MSTKTENIVAARKHHRTPEQRREEAAVRNHVRGKRTALEQLVIISKRAPESGLCKEAARLRAQMATK